MFYTIIISQIDKEMNLMTTNSTKYNLVNIESVDSQILIALFYKTDQNFTGEAIYPPDAQAYLRQPVAQALSKANKQFMEDGYKIKVWDAYRPFYLQKTLWKTFPDQRYVKQPIETNGVKESGSSHSKGAAVDMTLVHRDSEEELAMPTIFDDFTEKAHRDYMDLPQHIIDNRDYMEQIMKQYGFEGLPTEWWHFDWQQSQDFEFIDVPINNLD